MMKRIHGTGALMAAAMALSLLMPIAFWYRNTGPFAWYFSPDLPEGQLAYVLSKLFGMLALTGLGWQLVFALAGRLNVINPVRLRGWHHLLGFAVLALVLAHFLSFFAAASLRQGAAAWNLWVPDFRDYYHSRLTLGVFGLWALVTVVVAGILRLFWRPRFLAYLHRVYWLVIGFGFTHGLAVGSEFQSLAGLIFFAVLVCAVAGMAIWLGLLRYMRRFSPESAS